jgi:uncharacterized protein (PEP-CTERM system associated)
MPVRRRTMLAALPKRRLRWVTLRRARKVCLASCCAALCGASTAQGSTGLKVDPSLSTQLVFNSSSGRVGGDATDVVTQINPGIRLSSRSGRLVGSLDYQLQASLHSKQKDLQEVSNALSANAVAEVVPGWFYLDGRASVTQQADSAYGLQIDSGSVLANDNRIEVLNVSLSPYLKGYLGDAAEYLLRLSAAATNGRKSIAADSTNMGGSLDLHSRSGGAMLGWSLQASQQVVDFRAGRATQSDRVSAGLTFKPDPELMLSLRGGQESTDVGGFERRRYDNWGGGLRWSPTGRTLVGLEADRRYFGSSHQVNLEHRFRRVAIRFSSSRDVSNGANAGGTGQPVTLYQLWFAQFASIEPDPVARDLIVRDLLRQSNQDPNALVAGGALTSAITLQQRETLALTWTGQRTTFNLQAFSSSSKIIDNPTGQQDTGDTRQRGFTGTVSYRLTPSSNLNLMGSKQRTLASSGRSGTDLDTLVLSWTTLVNAHTSASLSARHSDFGSATDGYRESAVTASLNLRF